MIRPRAFLLCALALISSCSRIGSGGRCEGKPRPALGLDHISIVVASLDEVAFQYHALGFTLKAGRAHSNGLRNQHVKFADGTEMELITAPDPSDDLAKEYRQLVQGGEGPAFLALFPPSFEAGLRTLDASGLPFHREADLISFPPGHRLRYIFFGSRGQSPTDRPEHFDHPNTAESLIAVWLAADDLSPELRMLSEFAAEPCGEVSLPPLQSKARVVPLLDSALYLLPGSKRLIVGRSIVGVTLRVRDVEAAAREAARALPEAPRIETSDFGRSLFLPPSVTHGFWMELRQERPAAGAGS